MGPQTQVSLSFGQTGVQESRFEPNWGLGESDLVSTKLGVKRVRVGFNQAGG